MIEAIKLYCMPLYSPDPVIIEYYSEIFDGITCLQWGR